MKGIHTRLYLRGQSVSRNFLIYGGIKYGRRKRLHKHCISTALPIFDKAFRQRVQEGWQNFLEKESTIRNYIDEKMESEEIMGVLDSVLSQVF